MAKLRQSDEPAKQRRPPATTPVGRENQLISMAVELAEKQIREGTASSQVISHFLKLGSSREKLEQERIGMENQVLQAKAEQLASQKRVEELYADALTAMKAYSGDPIEPVYDDED